MSFFSELELVSLSREIWEDLVCDGPWTDRILAGVIITGTAVLAVILCFLMFVLADEVGRPIHIGSGQVIAKNHTAGGTSLISIGNSLMPVAHSARWTLNIKVDRESTSGSIGVKSEYYEQSQIGDRITVRYVNGRFTGQVYITGIE